MKEQIKALWKLCFDDTEEFIEMYFNMRYTDEVNIAIESNGQVISALQMIPYPMSFCRHTIQTSYISGACTHPDSRGSGVMRRLLTQSFNRMFSIGTHFSSLIPAEPWLFDYYASVGYASVFQHSVQEVDITENNMPESITVDTITNYQEDVYLYIYKKQAERACCILHTEDDFRVIMEDIKISDGFLWIAKEQEEIKGVAIGYMRGGQLVIKELFAENNVAEQHLLCSVGQQTSTEKIIRLLPPDDNTKTIHSLGMARIIRAKEVLQLYATAFPAEEMWLEISDKQLPANNGFYHLHEGKCAFSAKQKLPGTYALMGISELTNRILQPLRPYMSLMMD